MSESRGLAFAPFASEITSFSSPRNGAPRNAKSNRRNGSRRDSCTNARTAPIGSRGPNIPRSCVPSGRRTRTVTGSVRFVFLSSSSSSSHPRLFFFPRARRERAARLPRRLRPRKLRRNLASRLKNSSSSCARAARTRPPGHERPRAARPRAASSGPPRGLAAARRREARRLRGERRGERGAAATVAIRSARKLTRRTSAVYGRVSRRASTDVRSFLSCDTSVAASFSRTNPAATNASTAGDSSPEASSFAEASPPKNASRTFALANLTLRRSTRVAAAIFSDSVASAKAFSGFANVGAVSPNASSQALQAIRHSVSAAAGSVGRGGGRAIAAAASARAGSAVARLQSARRSAFRRDRHSHRASSPSSPRAASRAHGGSRRAWRPRPFPRSARLGSARLPKPPAAVFSAPPRQPWCPTCVPSPGTRKTHRRSPVVEGGVFRGFGQRASRARHVRDACQSRKRRRARGERSRETPRASVMSAFSDPTRGGMLERRGRSSSRLTRASAVREESSAPYRERVVLLRHRLHVGHHLFAHLVSVRHFAGRGRE